MKSFESLKDTIDKLMQTVESQHKVIVNQEKVISVVTSKLDKLEVLYAKTAPIERATRNNLPKDAVGINAAGNLLGTNGTKLAYGLRLLGAFEKRNNTNYAKPKYIEAGLFCKQTSQTFITPSGISWIKTQARRGVLKIK